METGDPGLRGIRALSPVEEVFRLESAYATILLLSTAVKSASARLQTDRCATRKPVLLVRHSS